MTVPISGDKAAIQVDAEVSGSTAKIARIDAAQISKIIEGNAKTGIVALDFTKLEGPIDTVDLPTDAVKRLAEAAQKPSGIKGMTVRLSTGEVTLDAGALAGLKIQAGERVTLGLRIVGSESLSNEQKKAAGDAAVIELVLRCDDKRMTTLVGGWAKVSLPYDPPEGQYGSGLMVYSMDDSGALEPCGTVYDAGGEKVVFDIQKMSLCLVRDELEGKEWRNRFPDVIENAWYYDAVKFVHERGLMNGFTDGTFGPALSVTRAQLAQILYNEAGRPAVSVNSLDDVAANAWYADAVTWAAKEGIVSGYGNGRFGPENAITREQLAVMLYRYIGSPVTNGTLDGFSDKGMASGYAVDALRWAVEQGILTGKGGGILDPAGTALRAEVATVLMRYLER